MLTRGWLGRQGASGVFLDAESWGRGKGVSGQG